MKDFFKNVLATIVGILLTGFILVIFGLLSIIGMAISSEKSASIKNNSVLSINLSGQMTERVEDDFMTQLSGQVSNNISLEDFISGVRKAKNNDKIKGIYLEAGAFAPDSYASLQAARNALLDFKKSGKWIVAYGDIYTQGAYYLASVADKLYLNPQGQIDWHGLAAQPVFLKDMLAKVGVKMQVAKVGTYKSATEQFTGDKMSDADRAQTTAYLNGIWQNITKGVSESRKISVATLNQYADSLITFAAPNEYQKLKLVDGLLYTDQVKKEVKKLLNIEEKKRINQVSLTDLKGIDDEDDGEEIAVYYAYGNIVDGNAPGMFSQGHLIDAQVVCKDIEDLMKDKDVKAVVLRINSGGGSAYASEQIWHQIVELKKAKPVVVSMGGMAASGGYYISAPANWIVAEPTTLTGSIGIFGMFPDLGGLYSEKLGLKFDEVKTNKNAAFGSMTRPFTPEEMSYLERYIDRGYKTFKNRVAQGRKMSEAQVENIAQGHVYTGQDAFKIKLVDELGGIEKAIAKAAKLANLKEYHTASYPVPVNWMTQFVNQMTQKNYLDEQLRATLGIYYEPFTLIKDLNNQAAIQARIPYYPNIK